MSSTYDDGWPDEEPSEWWPAEPDAAARPASRTSAERAPVERNRTHPARLALGMAVLAAERLRQGIAISRERSDEPRDRPEAGPYTVGGALAFGVGLAQQTAEEVRDVTRRIVGPTARAAWARLGRAAERAAPRTRGRLDRLVRDAARRGERTVAAGRADADALIRTGVNEGISWAQAQAVPQIVDSLVPHLVDSVVPRLIDGAMPEIRARVLPVVIDDLTNDPRLRELVMEQSLGVVDEAAEHLRSATATADDRVEAAFRRLVGGSGPASDR